MSDRRGMLRTKVARPNTRPLRESEVDLLPEGTRIIVLWAEMTDPWLYIVGVDRWGTRHACRIGSGQQVSSLTRCGRYPKDRVWRAP